MSCVQLIAGMHEVILDFFRLTRSDEPAWPESMRGNAWQHGAIASAIERRGTGQARAQLRLRIAYLKDREQDFDAERIRKNLARYE